MYTCFRDVYYLIRICLFLIMTFGLIKVSYGQEILSNSTEVNRYGIWYLPSNTTSIHGVCLSLFPELYENYPGKKINGLELGISPISIFMPPMTLLFSIDPKTHQPIYYEVQNPDLSDYKLINGIHLGIGSLQPRWINGLYLSGTGSFENVVNGANISLVLNKHVRVNGLTIAVIGNHDTECNGIQIALINTCQNLRGFQIGLWNKNEKRALPFFNWNFGKQQRFQN